MRLIHLLALPEHRLQAKHFLLVLADLLLVLAYAKVDTPHLRVDPFDHVFVLVVFLPYVYRVMLIFGTRALDSAITSAPSHIVMELRLVLYLGTNLIDSSPALFAINPLHLLYFPILPFLKPKIRSIGQLMIV